MDHIEGTICSEDPKIFVDGIRQLWNNSHHPDYVQKACEKTLADLSVPFLDLYLVHWPSAFQPGGQMIPKVAGVAQRDTETTLAQTWAEMEKLLEMGKVKNIGLSNFTKSEVSYGIQFQLKSLMRLQVEEVLKSAKHKPDVIQLELHPYLQQSEYVKWLQAQGIEVTAYSPFGNVGDFYGEDSSFQLTLRLAKSHIWRQQLRSGRSHRSRDRQK